MAKVTMTKLGLVLNKEVKTLTWNGQVIEVKQYLPIEDKLTLVSNIINNAVDDNGYYNTARIEIYETIGIIEAYTNISFTEKQKEDVFSLYDKLVSSGLWKQLKGYYEEPAAADLPGRHIGLIPEEELDNLHWWIYDIIDNIYKYKNSVMGILDVISSDYSNLSLDSETIRKNLSDPENLKLVKDVLTKLG